MFEPIPVWNYIADEMEARGWDRITLAVEMGGDEEEVQRNLCSLDILDQCRFEAGILLGESTAAKLATAFGTSAQLWLNLDKSCKSALAAGKE